MASLWIARCSGPWGTHGRSSPVQGTGATAFSRILDFGASSVTCPVRPDSSGQLFIYIYIHTHRLCIESVDTYVLIVTNNPRKVVISPWVAKAATGLQVEGQS